MLSRWCIVRFSLLGMPRRMTRDFGHYGTMVIHVHLVQLFYEGKTPRPLCSAYCFTSSLCTACGLILALRTAYRLATKTTFIGVAIYTKKIRIIVCYIDRQTHLCKQFCSLIVFSVLDPYSSCLVFEIITRNEYVRAKRARKNNIALFVIICPDCCFS